MKLKIAVCDDDDVQREYISRMAASWARKNRHLAKLRQYARAKDFLFDFSEEKDFDILLLDIEMPQMSGIELAKRVRLESALTQIVFVTGYYEYFSDGFDVSALHYLLKPIDEGKLMYVLDKAAGNLAYRQRSVLVADGAGSVKVALSDILYVESENVYVVVHSLQGNYRMRISMERFSAQLDETFFKVHRSYMVNLKYVKRITRTDITMENGDTIPISRGLYGEVHAALVKYL